MSVELLVLLTAVVIVFVVLVCDDTESLTTIFACCLPNNRVFATVWLGMQTPPLPSSELQKLFAELASALDRASTIAKIISERTGVSLPVPILVRPAHIPDDAAWFWSDHSQHIEKEANEDLLAGRIAGPFASVEELYTSLNP